MSEKSETGVCTLLACQVKIPIVRTPEDKRLHLENLVRKVSRCLDRQPADLVVLPELSFPGGNRGGG